VIIGGTQVLVANDAATVVIASDHECVVGDDVQYLRMTPKMQMTILPRVFGQEGQIQFMIIF
jgi:hypothetical protein